MVGSSSVPLSNELSFLFLCFQSQSETYSKWCTVGDLSIIEWRIRADALFSLEDSIAHASLCTSICSFIISLHFIICFCSRPLILFLIVVIGKGFSTFLTHHKRRTLRLIFNATGHLCFPAKLFFLNYKIGLAFLVVS